MLLFMITTKMSVPTLFRLDFINSKTDFSFKNDYVYYVYLNSSKGLETHTYGEIMTIMAHQYDTTTIILLLDLIVKNKENPMEFSSGFLTI